MAKTFYTERDIDDLKARGIDSIDVNDNIVLTELAVERAMKHGIKINRRELSSPQASYSPSVNTYAAYPREVPRESSSDAELKQKIKAAVLVHHGSEDTRLVMAWPEYENALKAAKVTYEGHIYPGAVHGFNNDATPQRYNKAAADDAWKRTVAWFNKYVRG